MPKPTLFSDVRDLLGAAILTAAAFLIAGTGSAKADSIAINCPVAQAQREITDPLPGGWWNTPLVSNLSAAEVAQIGGQTALICRYGNSGSIQRYAPVGMICNASGTGFTCSSLVIIPIPPVGPVVHAEGDLTIPLLGTADFDGGGRSDVIHFLSDGVATAIVPQNGARLSNPISGEPGYDVCSTETLRNRPVVLADILGGGFVCYKTNDGRFGQFEYLGVSGGTVSLHYTTWE